jgi:DNA polymerase III delta subunit
MICWLAGDRYSCIHRKNEIISDINKDGDWEIKNIPDFDNTKDLMEFVGIGDLFGSDNKIFIYDGNKTEKSYIKVLESIDKESVLIIITPNVDKKTVLYKTFKSNLDQYEALETFWGPPSKKDLTSARETLKWLSEWNGSDDLLLKILRACNYNYGCTVSEIEKIRLYNEDKSDKDISIEDVKPIISTYSRTDIGDLIKAINKEDKKKAFMILSRMFNLGNLEKDFMLLIYSLLNHFYLIFHCRLAIDNGIRNPFEIGKFVSENWIKKGSKVNPNAIYMQYKENTRIINSYTVEKSLEKIDTIEKTIRDIILGKMNRRYVINDMIFKIME